MKAWNANPDSELTYEQWFESQCNFGYDIDEDWLIAEIEHQCKAIGKANGIGEETLRPVLYKRGDPYAPSRQTLYYEVGGYNDEVLFECDTWLDKIPEDSPLRVEYPFAFEAYRLGFISRPCVDISGNRHYYQSTDYEWATGNTYYEFVDEPLREGSLYDGLPYEVFEEHAREQADELMPILEAIVKEVGEACANCLRADYDYFFSEERYNEEKEIN